MTLLLLLSLFIVLLYGNGMLKCVLRVRIKIYIYINTYNIVALFSVCEKLVCTYELFSKLSDEY